MCHIHMHILYVCAIICTCTVHEPHPYHSYSLEMTTPTSHAHTCTCTCILEPWHSQSLGYSEVMHIMSGLPTPIHIHILLNIPEITCTLVHLYVMWPRPYPRHSLKRPHPHHVHVHVHVPSCIMWLHSIGKETTDTRDEIENRNSNCK